MYKRDACLLSTIHNSEMKTGREMNKFQNLKKPFYNDSGRSGHHIADNSVEWKRGEKKRFFLPY